MNRPRFESAQMLLICASLLSVISFPTECNAQSLRICSYNMEDRPTSAADDQNMQVVLQAIGDLEILGAARAIDILAFQEGPANASEYQDIENNLQTVFGGNYSSSITNPDFAGCRTGFIYNQDTVQLISGFSLTGGLTHNSRRGHFRPIGGTAADDFYIYTIHLKAGSIDADDAATRAAEATILRANANTLPAAAQIIFCGDFNMSGAEEVAYQNFFAPGSNASAFETLNAPFGFLSNARWRDDRAFLPFHTQDPTNSMDDRFDAFFVNGTVVDGANFEYVKGSCSVLGNNATHELNQDINSGSGANGFSSQLVAFSDHLPVICDFVWGQSQTKFASSIDVDSSSTHFVRQTGPTAGATSMSNFEVEGTSNGTFAAFGIVDFDLAGTLDSGEFAGATDNVVLNMLQDNSGFTDGGAIEVYVATPAASQIKIDSGIQYQSGQNGIACVPAALATGAQKIATYASVHELNGSSLPDGSEDPIGLYGEAIAQTLSSTLNANGTLRLIVVPAIPQTAATYTGFASALGAPRLTADIVLDDGTIDVLANSFSVVNGIQGSGNNVDLNDSDDDRVSFTAGVLESKTDAPIQLVFTGSMGDLKPQTLSVTVEALANTPNSEFRVEIFDFNLGGWEEVGTANTQMVDSIAEFIAIGDVSRFITPTNTILTRVSWRPNGTVLFYPWSVAVDQFKWSVTQ